jgi:phage repressor protein C with HTH and peptisase S24 domain
MLQAPIVEKSQGAGFPAFCDISHDMKSTAKPTTYEVLAQLRPVTLSEAQWAKSAGVSSSFFQDLKKGARPRIDTLEKILDVIGVSIAQFSALESPQRETGVAASVLQDRGFPFRPQELPKDVPVMGTTLAADLSIDDNNKLSNVDSNIIIIDGVIDYIRRPPAIASRRNIYALYIQGNSMEPRFRQGELVYVDPNRPPQGGDDVIVQLCDELGGGEVVVGIVKEFVRRTASSVDLRQYMPELTFSVPSTRVKAVHRVIPLNEIFGV